MQEAHRQLPDCDKCEAHCAEDHRCGVRQVVSVLRGSPAWLLLRMWLNALLASDDGGLPMDERCIGVPRYAVGSQGRQAHLRKGQGKLLRDHRWCAPVSGVLSIWR